MAEFEDGAAIKNVEVTRRYAIRQWSQDEGRVVYDWIGDNGDESDELFETVEEAERDVQDR